MRFYKEHGVRFFLYAPALVLFSSSSSSSSCAIGVGADITYENGANVATSFLTNLEASRLRTAPTLYKRLKKANEIVLSKQRKSTPKYKYPDHVLTASMLAYLSKYGIDFRAERSETEQINALDEQKKAGKAIYGKGFLLSDRKAAEKAAAEKAAAECWTLSEKELATIRELNRREENAGERNMEKENQEGV